MSLAAQPVSIPTLAPKVESVLHPEQADVTITTHGNQAVRERVLRADSHNAQGSTFSTVLNPKDLLDRDILIRVPLVIDIAASGATYSIDATTLDNLTLASNAIHRVMKNATLTLNNISKNVEPANISSALSLFRGGKDYHAANFGLSMPDRYNTLNRNDVTEAPFARSTGYGELSRQDYPFTQIETQTTTLGQIIRRTYMLTMALDHPLLSGVMSDEALANVTNIGLSVTWGAWDGMLLMKDPVLDSDGAAASITFDYGLYPELLLRTYQPSVTVPKSVTVPASDYIVKRFNVPGFLGTTSIETGNISLSQVPNRIFVFAGPASTISDSITPDYFAGITGLTVRTAGNSGGLSGSTPQQLWQMSRAAGSEQTFAEFSDSIGSVICIDVDDSLGGFTAGVREPFTHDLQVTLSNIQFIEHANKISVRTPPVQTGYTLNVVYEMSSKLTLEESGQGMLSGGTEVNNVVKSLQGGFVHSHDLAGAGTRVGGGTKIGGGFFRSFKRGFKMPFRAVAAVSPLLALGGPQAQKLGQAGVAADTVLNQLM